MPQKSTFFYPKVPTGLAIHTLDPRAQSRRCLKRPQPARREARVLPLRCSAL